MHHAARFNRFSMMAKLVNEGASKFERELATGHFPAFCARLLYRDRWMAIGASTRTFRTVCALYARVTRIRSIVGHQKAS